MKVIIAGPRAFCPNSEEVMHAVENAAFYVAGRISGVVSGMSGGVDASGIRFADEIGVRLYEFPADWSTHGKAAGPIRNREMAAFADALVVVKPEGSETPGTSSMISEAQKAGIPVHIEEISP